MTSAATTPVRDSGHAETGGILLIDDDPVFAREVRSLLAPNESFLWLENSRRAVDRIRETRPRVILVDLNLPRHLAMLDEEEGLEILSRLTPEERSHVIVVTQGVSPSVRERIEQLRIERIYLKPESVAKLAAWLQREEEGFG